MNLAINYNKTDTSIKYSTSVKKIIIELNVLLKNEAIARAITPSLIYIIFTQLHDGNISFVKNIIKTIKNNRYEFLKIDNQLKIEFKKILSDYNKKTYKI